MTSFWKNKAPRFPDKKMAVIRVIKGLRPFFCSQSSDAKYITPPVKQPALRFVDVQAAFCMLKRSTIYGTNRGGISAAADADKI